MATHKATHQSAAPKGGPKAPRSVGRSAARLARPWGQRWFLSRSGSDTNIIVISVQKNLRSWKSVRSWGGRSGEAVGWVRRRQVLESGGGL